MFLLEGRGNADSSFLCSNMKTKLRTIFGYDVRQIVTCSGCNISTESNVGDFLNSSICKKSLPWENIKEPITHKNLTISTKMVQGIFEDCYKEEYLDDEDNLKECNRCSGQKLPYSKQ